MRLFELLSEEPIKLRGFGGDDVPDSEAIADFMEMLNDATQNHPFDSSQRIGWDGKSTIEVRAMPDHIHLVAIQTLAPGERTGSASSLLDDVIEISRRTGVKLRLSPKPFGTTKGKLNKSQLIAWYKRKGFVPASQGEMEFDPDANNLNEYKEVTHDTEESVWEYLAGEAVIVKTEEY
jgi:hypothetical protein